MRIKFKQGYSGPAGIFSSGDVAEIDKNEAIDICNAGLAYPTKEKFIETQTVDYPQHVGGGWYKLSNGNKVQGENKAKKKEYEIQSHGG